MSARTTVKKIIDTLFPLTFYAVIFLVPWQTRLIITQGLINGQPWEYGTTSLYATDIAIMLLAALYLLEIILHRTRRPSTNSDTDPTADPASTHSTRRTSPLTVLTLILLIVGLFSLTWTSDTSLTGFALLKLAEGIFLAACARHPRVHLRAALWTLTITGALQSLLAYGQFGAQIINPHTWLGLAAQNPATPGTIVVETANERLLRAYGSFPHPNMLAGFLEITLFAAGALVTTARHRLERLTATLLSLLIAFGLFLTFSRSAWLALVCGLVILALASVHHRRRGLTWMWIAMTVATLGVQIMLAPQLIFSRLEGQARLEQQSTDDRALYAQQARSIVAHDEWIFGVGLGNYTNTIHETVDKGQPGWWYQPVHFTPLLIMAELGLFGGVVYVLLLLAVLMTIFRHVLGHGSSHGSTGHHILVMLAIMSLSTFVIGWFDHYFWTLHSGILMFWLVFGLWQKQHAKLEVKND